MWGHPPRGVGGGGECGGGGPDGVQTLGNRVASLGARPSRREEDGRGGGTDRPRWPAGPGRRCAGPGAGDSTPRPDTHHARGPRHSQSARSAHSGAGRRAGIFSVAASAAAACADPHEEGVPTEGPPLAPLLLLLLQLTASRGAPKLRSKCPHSPHPKPAASRPPPQPQPEVWLKLSRLCSEAVSCSSRLGRLLPPQTPRPCRRGRASLPSAPRGSPQEEAPAGAARRDLLRVLDCPQLFPTVVGTCRALTPSTLDCPSGPGLC